MCGASMQADTQSVTCPKCPTIPRFRGDTSWMDEGLCMQTDPEIFFPGTGESGRDAKAVCGKCPVMTECAAYAIARTELTDGIWGGLSARERMRLRNVAA